MNELKAMYDEYYDLKIKVETAVVLFFQQKIENKDIEIKLFNAGSNELTIKYKEHYYMFHIYKEYDSGVIKVENIILNTYCLSYEKIDDFMMTYNQLNNVIKDCLNKERN